MQQTSILAYQEAKKNLSRTQSQVYEAIEEHGEITNKQLAKVLGWEINSITPRVKELREKGKVVECYKGTDISGRVANYWGTPAQLEAWLAKQRAAVHGS
jgi:DNA-binding MarR family transcriptional regulator